MADFVCAHCDKAFKASPSRRPSAVEGKPVYCSRTCYLAATENRVTRVCEACGAEFEVHNSKTVSGHGKYCSESCKYAHFQKHLMAGEWRACLTCGTSFYAKRHKIERENPLYCSSECRGLGQREQVTLECRHCGASFERPPSVIEHGGGSYCSKKCQLADYAGESNPNWRGGIDSHERRRALEAELPATLTEEQWNMLLDAYGHKCAYCGEHPENGGALHKEHVVPVSRGGGYTLENIVPACGSCNSRKHARVPGEGGIRFRRYVCVTFW